MSKIAAGSLHKYLTGEVVTGDDTQVATNLNIVFETIRLALNDADARVDNTYTKAQIDALNYTKAQVDAIQAALANALTTHKTSADHDGRYYTETEIDGKITVLNNADTANTNALTTHKASADHDGRYYTETEIDSKITTLNGVDATNANNLTNHKSSGDHDSRYFTKSEISSTELGESGASIIGVTPIATSPDDLQGMVEWLKNQIDSAVTGTIPDASITKIKLHPEVTTQLIPFGTTTGTANNYAITLSPAPSAYTDGMPISFKVHTDASAASSLNVNGLGAKNIVKASGAAVTNLKNNGVYTVRYNSATGNFILQGEGGGGNAISGDIRVGKTATTDAGDVTGTMPTVTQSFNPSTSIQVIPAGYHAGTGQINPVVGNTNADQVIAGQIFSSASGISQVGTMPFRGNMSINASNVAQTIPLGYHSGGGRVEAVTFNAWALLSGNTVAGTAGLMANYAGTTGPIAGYDMVTELIPHPDDPTGQGRLTVRNGYDRTGYFDSTSHVQANIWGLIPSNIKKGAIVGKYIGTGSQVMVGTGPEFGTGDTIPMFKTVPAGAANFSRTNTYTDTPTLHSQTTVATGQGRAAMMWGGMMQCLDANGGLIWQRNWDGAGTTVKQMKGSMFFDWTHFYVVTTENYLYAINWSDGSTRWVSPGTTDVGYYQCNIGESWDGYVYVGDNGGVAKHAVSNGALIWRIGYDAGRGMSVVHSTGQVFFLESDSSSYNLYRVNGDGTGISESAFIADYIPGVMVTPDFIYLKYYKYQGGGYTEVRRYPHSYFPGSMALANGTLMNWTTSTDFQSHFYDWAKNRFYLGNTSNTMSMLDCATSNLVNYPLSNVVATAGSIYPSNVQPDYVTGAFWIAGTNGPGTHRVQGRFMVGNTIS
jgi:hypothetical protein